MTVESEVSVAEFLCEVSHTRGRIVYQWQRFHTGTGADVIHEAYAVWHLRLGMSQGCLYSVNPHTVGGMPYARDSRAAPPPPSSSKIPAGGLVRGRPRGGFVCDGGCGCDSIPYPLALLNFRLRGCDLRAVLVL